MGSGDISSSAVYKVFIARSRPLFIENIMANYIIKTKSHSEWLEHRSKGIGSSDVAAILGLSKWKTPYKLWLEKTGQSVNQEDESPILRAGHYLEPVVAQYCADETGLEIIKTTSEEFIVVDKERPYLRVSPDRYAWLPNCRHTKDNKVIIECKTTQNGWDPDDIPTAYFLQCMYQMGVCEINQTYLAWLERGLNFNYKRLVFDKDFYQDVIVAEVEKFWTDYVIGGQEPPLVDVSDVLLKFPKQTDGKVISASESVMEAYLNLKETNAEIKRLESVKTDLEETIKMSLLDAETLVSSTDNKALVTWKAGKAKSKFDEKKFSDENPELYAKYITQVQPSRRFTLK